MTNRRISTAAAIALASALALAGCTAPGGGAPRTSAATTPPPAPVSGSILGAGSMAQKSALQAWAGLVAAAHPGAQVGFDARGSALGRQAFREGQVPFAASDVPFSTDEVAAGGFRACAEGAQLVEIPAYVSPVAIVFALDGVDALKLSPRALAGVFAGTVTRWDDPAIVATNPTAALPSKPILPVHRSDASGTTAHVTDYLSQTAPDVWTAGTADTWPSALDGRAAQGAAGLAAVVRATDGGIGYVDASVAGDLPSVQIKVGGGWVEASAAGARTAMDAARIEQGRAPGDLATTIDRGTPARGAYPVLLVGYLIGCSRYEDAETAALVKTLFSTAVSAEGQQRAADAAGSAPISEELRTRAQAAIDLIS